MRTTSLLALIAVLAIATGSAAQEETEIVNRYKLQSGDTLDIAFPYTPDFNQTVVIQPDGFLHLKVLGDMRAGGMTVPQLKAELESQYSSILREPLVTIELRDFERPFFIAGGFVARPGKYDIRGDITLTEALAIAGGMAPDAKHTQVMVFRRESDEWVEVKTLNLKKVMDGSDPTQDVPIQPGDMVFVPERALAKMRPFLPDAIFRLMIEPF